MGLLTAVASAEKQPFERYQSIIDRQMFGPLPPGFDPTKLPSEVQKSSSAQERELSKEQEQLKSAIHFSVINVAADGKTEVGFTDNSDPENPGWQISAGDFLMSMENRTDSFLPAATVVRTAGGKIVELTRNYMP